MHRFAGSWIPGKENGAGIVNVTDELCFPKPDGERRRRLLGWYAPDWRARLGSRPSAPVE